MRGQKLVAIRTGMAAAVFAGRMPLQVALIRTAACRVLDAVDEHGRLMQPEEIVGVGHRVPVELVHGTLRCMAVPYVQGLYAQLSQERV